MKLFKSTYGNISTLAAFSIAFLLISTITISFIFIVENQGQTTTANVEHQKQTLTGIREQIKATLQQINNQLNINVQNTGPTPTKITQLLITKPNNSLDTIPLNPPKTLLPLEKQTLTVTYTEPFTKLGLLTQKGNTFPIQTTPLTPTPTTTPTSTPTPTPSSLPTPTPIPTSTPPSTPLPTYTPTHMPTLTPLPTTQPFDFTLSLSTTNDLIEQGASTTLTVTATLLSGSPQQVSFSASDLPDNAYATFTPTSNMPTFASTLTITTSPNTPTGTYTITVAGTGGGLTKTATYTLTITSQPFDFTITVNPQSGSMIAGNSITATITVSTIKGSPQPVSLSMNHAGAPASLNPTTGTPNPYYTSTLTISNAHTGTYNIVIYATNGKTIHSTTYTLTVSTPPTATVHFYFSGAGNSGTPLTIDGISYPANTFPLSFTWPVGSHHTYAWTSFQTDESPYINGLDTGYAWSYSTSTNSLPTTITNTITVPPNGGSITSYYTRHIYIDIKPSSGGSITPNSGWHQPGTSFTATPNPNYQFNHWTINSATSTTNPITLHNPTTLQATFTTTTIPLSVKTQDYQGYPINGATIYIYTAQQTLYTSSTTASNGLATFQIQPGSYYIAIMQTTNAFGYTTNFHNWNDGNPNPVKPISLTAPTTLTATYKTPLIFQNLAGGTGTNGFSVGYWASGTITSIHNTPISDVTVHTTWNPGDGLERSTYTTTSPTGTFNTQTYIGLIATEVYAIDFRMTNAPTGYQPLNIHRYYP